MFVSLCQWLKFCASYVIVNFSLDLLNIERKKETCGGKTTVESFNTFGVSYFSFGLILQIMYTGGSLLVLCPLVQVFRLVFVCF